MLFSNLRTRVLLPTWGFYRSGHFLKGQVQIAATWDIFRLDLKNSGKMLNSLREYSLPCQGNPETVVCLRVVGFDLQSL